MAPIWAGLIIGTVWGLWHIPTFYLGGAVQSSWAFAPFFIGNIVLAGLCRKLFELFLCLTMWQQFVFEGHRRREQNHD
jgi:hypothetical protein